MLRTASLISKLTGSHKKKRTGIQYIVGWRKIKR